MIATITSKKASSKTSGLKKASPEEQRLWNDYYSSGRSVDTMNNLAIRYMPIAREWTSRMQEKCPSYVCFDDLFSGANFGLMDAITKYDPQKGTVPSTYIVKRVRGCILDNIRQNDWVPRLARRNHSQHQRIESIFYAEQGRSPTEKEVAVKMGITIKEYETVKSKRNFHPTRMETIQASSSHNLDEDGDVWSVLENRKSKDPSKTVDDGDFLDRYSEYLSPRELSLIKHYYEDGKSMKEIGKMLNVTEVCISGRHKRIIRKLREIAQFQGISS